MKNITYLVIALLLGISGIAQSSVDVSEDEYVVFYHHDVLGSPVAVTDDKGRVLWNEHSQPYGKSMGRKNTDGEGFRDNAIEEASSRMGFTGHTVDNTADLVYMKARYYDPVIGRFYSNDPVGFSAGSPMSSNRYAYGNNNPYRFTDPDGRDARDVQIILNDIRGRFPEMRPSTTVRYENIGQNNGATTLHPENPELVLPTKAETEKLDDWGFFSLYGTILHESMHASDPLYKRIWDGLWGDKKTNNHQDIGDRVEYEMQQVGGDNPPTMDVWSNGPTPVKPAGVDTDELFESTREKNDDSN